MNSWALCARRIDSTFLLSQRLSSCYARLLNVPLPPAPWAADARNHTCASLRSEGTDWTPARALPVPGALSGEGSHLLLALGPFCILRGALPGKAPLPPWPESLQCLARVGTHCTHSFCKYKLRGSMQAPPEVWGVRAEGRPALVQQELTFGGWVGYIK